MEKRKPVSASETEQVHIVRAQYINGFGRLFGGNLLQWIDEITGIVGRRHSESQVITAAIDNLSFIGGAKQNDLIVLKAKVTYVGRSSMEIRVDTYEEEMNGTRRIINTAYVVMVAVDKQERPIEVPGLLLETDEEKAEWEAGQKRYQLRQERRKEGY